MKRIFHLVGFGRNFGDMAIQLSMMDMLQKKSKEALQFIPIDLKTNTPIDRDLVEYINEVGDMLLVGGGGMIMKGDGFDTLSGWQFNISLEDLKLLQVPLVIYGIGYNDFQLEELSSRVNSHLMATLWKSSLFSVRDEGTRQQLLKRGLDIRDVIPDPAMFCPSHPVTLPNITQDSFCIGLNLAGDRLDQRFPPMGDYFAVIEKLCSSLSVFSRSKSDVRLFYIPHIDIYDHKLWKVVKSRFDGRCQSIADIFPNMFPESLARVPMLAGIYQRMDIVVGMRGHSNIIPFGQGTPVVGFGSHDKNKFFAQQAGTKVVGNDCDGLLECLSEELDCVKRAVNVDTLDDLWIKIDRFNEKVISLLENRDAT
ncbi:hypothetical protein LCGC14_0232060 [marine sediment metagenome]|uniref:Polysaccharide pyruvyl transferase domain-containing protein n=1 Tax=marine sediment metagenome TaxID=412755 RepID=A0A0F9XE84_9ZZZZ